jgi:hypothetical protein
LFGSKEDWNEFEIEWSKVTKGKEVHASECETRDKRFYAQLVTALAHSNLFGWGAVMSLEDYSRIFDQSVRELPYYFCFQKVVEHFAEFTSLMIPRGKAELTLDRNRKTQHSAEFMYKYFISLSEWADREFLADGISFSSREDPKIQGADLWAREVMKHGERIMVLSSTNMRLSLQAFRRTNRFGFDMFDKAYFEDMKRQIKERHRPGHSIHEYHQWRTRQKMQDTTENRIRYHMYMNMLEAAEAKET